MLEGEHAGLEPSGNGHRIWCSHMSICRQTQLPIHFCIHSYLLEIQNPFDNFWRRALFIVLILFFPASVFWFEDLQNTGVLVTKLEILLPWLDLPRSRNLSAITQIVTILFSVSHLPPLPCFCLYASFLDTIKGAHVCGNPCLISIGHSFYIRLLELTIVDTAIIGLIPWYNFQTSNYYKCE